MCVCVGGGYPLRLHTCKLIASRPQTSPIRFNSASPQGFFRPRTNMTLCVEDDRGVSGRLVGTRFLHVAFSAMDDPLLKNTYLKCNSDMWK